MIEEMRENIREHNQAARNANLPNTYCAQPCGRSNCCARTIPKGVDDSLRWKGHPEQLSRTINNCKKWTDADFINSGPASLLRRTTKSSASDPADAQFSALMLDGAPLLSPMQDYTQNLMRVSRLLKRLVVLANSPHWLPCSMHYSQYWLFLWERPSCARTS